MTRRARAARAARAVAFAAGALLASCAGLPPRPPRVALPAEVPLAAPPVAGAATWPAAQWWKAYDDATLDVLIERALADSPSLAGAQARYQNARESVRLASAVASAHLDANGDVSRQRLSDNGLFSPTLLGFEWYNQEDLGLQASYTFDWWGKERAAVEAAMDEARAAQAERSAAALMLASAVADAYFGWQADEAHLALTRERVHTLEHEREIAAARLGADLESSDALARSDAALAAARAQGAALEGSAALRRVALAALLGCSSDALPPLTARPLPAVETTLPETVRIDLMARRADITASRWRVEAAEQSRLEARADFLPNVSISALIGVQSIDAAKLLEYTSRVPGAGAAVHLPIFDAGRLRARYGVSEAAVAAAVASYRDTLVSAARDVATQAATLSRLAAERAERTRALEAAAALRASAAARVAQGIVDPREELTATESWLSERDALLELDAAAVVADIALTRALGGGFYEEARS